MWCLPLWTIRPVLDGTRDIRSPPRTSLSQPLGTFFINRKTLFCVKQNPVDTRDGCSANLPPCCTPCEYVWEKISVDWVPGGVGASLIQLVVCFKVLGSARGEQITSALQWMMSVLHSAFFILLKKHPPHKSPVAEMYPCFKGAQRNQSPSTIQRVDDLTCEKNKLFFSLVLLQCPLVTVTHLQVLLSAALLQRFLFGHCLHCCVLFFYFYKYEYTTPEVHFIFLSREFHSTAFM